MERHGGSQAKKRSVGGDLPSAATVRMASSMAMLVAPSAKPVFNNRQVASGYSSEGKPLSTSQNLTCGGITIYYPARVGQRFCIGLAEVLYTKTLYLAIKEALQDRRVDR
jgi:hypothetical protein